MLIRWCGKVERQNKSGVVKIGIEGAIANVEVTWGDIIVLATIQIMLLHAVE